jgi:hypothetical protein
MAAVALIPLAILLTMLTGCAVQYEHTGRTTTEFERDFWQCRMTEEYDLQVRQVGDHELFSYRAVGSNLIDRCLQVRGWRHY